MRVCRQDKANGRTAIYGAVFLKLFLVDDCRQAAWVVEAYLVQVPAKC